MTNSEGYIDGAVVVGYTPLLAADGVSPSLISMSSPQEAWRRGAPCLCPEVLLACTPSNGCGHGALPWACTAVLATAVGDGKRRRTSGCHRMRSSAASHRLCCVSKSRAQWLILSVPEKRSHVMEDLITCRLTFTPALVMVDGSGEF